MKTSRKSSPKKATDKCLLITFGLAGHNESLVLEKSSPLSSNCSMSGHSKPDTWKAREKTDYVLTPVIDKRAVLEKDCSLAWLSPMPCTEVNRCAPLDKAGPIDFVSISDYLTWWRAKGARIGTCHRESEEKVIILWEDGTRQPQKLSLFERLAVAGITLTNLPWSEIALLKDNQQIYKGSGYGADLFLDTLGIPSHS